MTSLRQRLENIGRGAIGLVWPVACAGCGKPGAALCVACQANLPWLEGPLCGRCGRPVVEASDQCWACRHWSPALAEVRTAFLYAAPVSTIIQQLKYRSAAALAGELCRHIAARPPRWQRVPDVMVPVALHPRRQRERGYNQSAILARALAAYWQWPVCESALRRVRHTTPQVSLDGPRRQANMVGAFAGAAVDVAGRAVLLVDDVFTTGATMRAAAEALREAGATSVAGFCVARTG